MGITILVAKILGIYFVVSGVFLMTKGQTLPHLLKDFFDHPSVVYLTGVILIFLSSMYLIQYNVWNGTLQGLVTLLVWVIMLKGLGYIFFPKVLKKITVQKFRGLLGVYGLIAVIVGLFLFFSV